ncbi:MAG: thiamine-phosphate kinase [Planctomycetales bacterium]|nr:thiamine-phosphate kinase [Planctomycetales bacterium]
MEQSFVAWAKIRSLRLPQVKLGIGDDAAILAPSDLDLVVTTDSMMDGTHFRVGECDLRSIGEKLVGVNLSDLAAMGAEPNSILLSMCLPSRNSEELAAEIYEGVCTAAARYEVALAGGDTNCWSGPLVLHMTAIGFCQPEQAWLRSGAKPNDLIVVTGELGGSIQGKHLKFQPRLDVVRKLRGRLNVHAAMDISDGLSIDLLRMCDASRCGAVLDLENIPVSLAATELSKSSGLSALDHALGDGEDFELLLAVSVEDLNCLTSLLGKESVRVVGEFTSRTGLWARRGGQLTQLPATGYIHR